MNLLREQCLLFVRCAVVVPTQNPLFVGYVLWGEILNK